MTNSIHIREVSEISNFFNLSMKYLNKAYEQNVYEPRCPFTFNTSALSFYHRPTDISEVLLVLNFKASLAQLR